MEEWGADGAYFFSRFFSPLRCVRQINESFPSVPHPTVLGSFTINMRFFSFFSLATVHSVCDWFDLLHIRVVNTALFQPSFPLASEVVGVGVALEVLDFASGRIGNWEYILTLRKFITLRRPP